MSEEEVGSLADELRSLAAVVAERSPDGEEGLLRSIRERLAGTPGQPDGDGVRRIEIT